MSELKDGRPAFYAQNRDEWRAWLEKNSKTEPKIWLILYHKKSQVPCVSLDEATEEALCFGWIDSLCKGRDHQSYYLTYSPRNPKRNTWSPTNIARAEKMIREGKMTEQGRELFERFRDRNVP